MFSDAPAEPPSPSRAAPGEAALDARWRAATTGWRPSSIRSADAERTWAWLRHAWEDVLAPGDDDGPLQPAAEDRTGGPGRRVRDLLVVAALLVLRQRFLAAGAEDPDGEDPGTVPDPRAEGAPLADAEVLAVVGALWDLGGQGPEEDPEGFAAELSGYLQDHLGELADDALEHLVARHGRTRVFAELWSLGHPDEVEAPGEDAPFPLATDDVAWIVSGVPTPGKQRAWEWLGR